MNRSPLYKGLLLSICCQNMAPKVRVELIWGHPMEPRVQKFNLQTILKAAHVNKDMIELEFRI